MAAAVDQGGGSWGAWCRLDSAHAVIRRAKWTVSARQRGFQRFVTATRRRSPRDWVWWWIQSLQRVVGFELDGVKRPIPGFYGPDHRRGRRLLEEKMHGSKDAANAFTAETMHGCGQQEMCVRGYSSSCTNVNKLAPPPCCPPQPFAMRVFLNTGFFW